MDDDASIQLQRFVADRDELCPACRYNLRALRSDRCPECGLPLRLRVSLSEPAWGTYLASLVGLSVGLGFCAILLLYGAVATFFSGFGPGLITFVPLIAGSLVCGGGVAWLLRRRRRFVALRLENRRTVVAAAWVLGVGFPIVFFVLIDAR